MASFLEKIRLRTAKRPIKNFDISCQHLSSQNFNQYMPIYHKQMIPGSSIDINASSFERFEPMPQPTFMESETVNRAFFVPYHHIWRPWNEFITDTYVSNSSGSLKIERVPYFNPQTFCRWFLGHYEFEKDYTTHHNTPFGVSAFDLYDLNSSVNVVKRIIHTETEGIHQVGTADPTNFDIFIVRDVLGEHDDTNPNKYFEAYTLTARGRYVLKIMESLGYRFDWFNYQKSGLNTSYWTRPLSALPLLSYIKVLFDWYQPAQYVKGTDTYTAIATLFKHDDSFTFTSQMFDVIFDFLSDFILPADYFTSCFDNTDFPNIDTQNAQDIVYEDQNHYNAAGVPDFRNTVGSDSTHSAELTNVQGSAGSILGTNVTNWGVNLLSSLSSFLKRNQLSGARVVDRMLSRFGVKLNDTQLNRSIYLGEDRFYSQMGDVISTNASEDDTLAQLAGKGVSFSNNGNFSYQTNEFGMFIIVNHITPRTSYTQGSDRNNGLVTMLDFYTPEFDCMGMQSVKTQELFLPRSTFDLFKSIPRAYQLPYFYHFLSDNNFSTALLPTSHFGFTPRYSENKFGRDLVTGNFSNPNTGIGYPSWINSRIFNLFDINYIGGDAPGENTYEYVDLSDLLQHSYDFMNDNSYQYNRLFYNNNSLSDNILCQHYFKVSYNAPMAPLFDTFEFNSQNYGDDIKLNTVGGSLDK